MLYVRKQYNALNVRVVVTFSKINKYVDIKSFTRTTITLYKLIIYFYLIPRRNNKTKRQLVSRGAYTRASTILLLYIMPNLPISI